MFVPTLSVLYQNLRYYSGNYDMYVQLRRDQDMVQLRQYEAEQRDIAEIKDFIARFGHGTVKMVRQAQSREKFLQKTLEAGSTEKPEEIKMWDWSFPDAGQLPVPVLAIEKLSLAYPGSQELYYNVDFGIDLQTRVALVGPNGAAKKYAFQVDSRRASAYQGCGEAQPLENVASMFIQAMDLAVIVPLCGMAGMLLLHRSAWGYLLALVALPKFVTYLLVVTLMGLNMLRVGVSVSPVDIWASSQPSPWPTWC